MDDFLSISDQDELNDQIETELNKHFEFKSLGQPSIIIRVKVHQEDHLIEISQLITLTHCSKNMDYKMQAQYLHPWTQI